MKRRLFGSLTVLVFGLLIILQFPLTGYLQTESPQEAELIGKFSQTYESHSPIDIDGNEDFISTAEAEGWPGSGTAEQPYRISGYDFVSVDHAIRVVNSDVHFVFANNRIDGVSGTWCSVAIGDSSNIEIYNNIIHDGAVGVHVVTVSNVVIRNNTCYDCAFEGIVVENDSTNVVVRDNTVRDNEGPGIYIGNEVMNVAASTEVIVEENRIYGNKGPGITIAESRGNTFSDNIIYDNVRAGILVDHNIGDRNVITGNTIYDNPDGISIHRGDRNIVEGNDIHSNFNGIFVYSTLNVIRDNLIYFNTNLGIGLFHSQIEGLTASNCIITENVIGNNTNYGIKVYSLCENHTITWNDILLNCAPCQIFDDGTDIEIQNNYYSDWLSPDDDVDGYVDNPYEIEGANENSDTQPLAAPHNQVPEWYEYTTTTTGETGTASQTTTSDGELLPPEQLDLALPIVAGIGVVIVLVAAVVGRKITA